MWAPDGRLVISVERDDTSRLAVVDADDAWPRRLAIAHGDLEEYGDEGDAAVSPDGTEVAYTFCPRGDLKRGEIRVASLDGGAVRALTGTAGDAGPRPAWSPDGTTIAYSSERSGFYELHAVGRDGSGERQLTSAEADHTEAEWHPDGDAAGGGARPAQPLRPRGGDASSGSAELVAEGGTWTLPALDRRGRRSWRPTRTTPPPRSCARWSRAPSRARSTRRPRGRSARRRTPRSRTSCYESFDGLEIPGFLMRPRDAGMRPARAGGGLPARRPHRRLRRRLGRSRAVLRGPGLRLARR